MSLPYLEGRRISNIEYRISNRCNSDVVTLQPKQLLAPAEANFATKTRVPAFGGSEKVFPKTKQNLCLAVRCYIQSAVKSSASVRSAHMHTACGESGTLYPCLLSPHILQPTILAQPKPGMASAATLEAFKRHSTPLSSFPLLSSLLLPTFYSSLTARHIPLPTQ